VGWGRWLRLSDAGSQHLDRLHRPARRDRRSPVDRHRRRLPVNALAGTTIGLFKTELHRNPAAIDQNGGSWRGLDDLEIATCGWVSWFNDERIHGELDDLTPAEVEAAWVAANTDAEAA
jgi:transposase InsO family protein